MSKSQNSDDKQPTEPLWKKAVYRVIGGLPATELANEEFEALFDKATTTMRPPLPEQKAMAHDKTKQAAFIKTFVNAYKGGIPPWSHISEAPKKQY